MSIFNGVAGRRSGNPLGVCFHNDAGSQSADVGLGIVETVMETLITCQ